MIKKKKLAYFRAIRPKVCSACVMLNLTQFGRTVLQQVSYIYRMVKLEKTIPSENLVSVCQLID